MFDKRDIQILEILQENGRATASDIAKEVKCVKDDILHFKGVLEKKTKHWRKASADCFWL